MKKNGFTLIEVILTVIILSIISLIVVPIITKVRNNILQGLYESKVTLINNAARDYGNNYLNYIPSFSNSEYNFTDSTDTTVCNDKCLCVSVETLINQGYIKGDSDDKTQITNPLNNNSMNSLGVCVRYDTNIPKTRKIISYITGYDDELALKEEDDIEENNYDIKFNLSYENNFSGGTKYFLTDYNCNKNVTTSYDKTNNKLNIDNYKGNSTSCEITVNNKPLLSEVVKIGDYVLYEGSNGCSNTTSSLDTVFNSQCKGMNQNYISSSSMGYCYRDLYKYYTNGWRIAYLKDTNSNNVLEAYIVAAGSTSCIDNVSGNSADSILLLNSEALKYCNPNYAYGGACQSSYDITGSNYNTWALKGSDFYRMTLQLYNEGRILLGFDVATENTTGSACYNEYSVKSCGYNNDLIDNGGLYWFGSAQSGESILMWGSYGRYITSSSASLKYGIRPVIHLKESIYVTGGSGTQEDPYTISY